MPPSAEAARADEEAKNLHWDLFRWGTLSLGIVLSGTAVSALTLAGSAKSECPGLVLQRVGTSAAVLAAMAASCLLTYGLYYVRLPVSDRAHKELKLPFTRSRMVSRAGLCFFGTALNAAVWTIIVIAVAAVAAEAALATAGGGAPAAAKSSFLQRLAQEPKGGGSAAKPAADPSPAPEPAAPARLWPEEGGPIGDAGACGDELLGGAMIAAEGFAGIADAVGLFFCAVMLMPVLCPVCRDRRCGNARPVTVRLPLFLAPAGLIYPPELRDELAAVLDASAKASLSGPGGATCVSGKPVPDSLGAAVAERLHCASLNPWREVEVESWYRVGPDGSPVDAHETRIRDAFLARVATVPWSRGVLADTSAPGWAAALPEAAELSPASRSAYLAAMASVFGASAVAESPTDEAAALELHDAIGDTEDERLGKQPRLPVFLRDWDPETSYR